jgi:hypothetical protein
MASDNWMWAAAEEIHTRIFELDNAAAEYAMEKHHSLLDDGIRKRQGAVHLKWSELAAEIISKHYMKCPSCNGTGWFERMEIETYVQEPCEECHGTGEQSVPF